MKHKFILLAVTVLLLIENTGTVKAESYVTIVNPVRSRELWFSKDLQNLQDQKRLSTEFGLSTTWLLQYDVLKDSELVQFFKKLPKNHEVGLWFEISEKLATDAFVPYTRGEKNWSRPDMVFTSGYTIEERYRLVDRIVRTFQSIFNYTPKSVGAWYIDAPVITYLKNKYGIEVMLTCSDQYSTDRYQKWGKYFSTPYYPSKFNTLIPAVNPKNQLDVVAIQWALRDPVRSYGSGISASTYSLQANDYAGHHKLTIDYFKKLFEIYNNEKNPISQITVGLESGMESQRFFKELSLQMQYINKLVKKGKIKAVTMKEFAGIFKKTMPSNRTFAIYSHDLLNNNQWALWWMTPKYRVGVLLREGTLVLRDLKLYDETITSIDYVFADKRHTLYRTVPSVIDSLVTKNEQIIAENVQDISYKQTANYFIINVKTDFGNRTITFDETTIKIDGQAIFKRSDYNPVPEHILRSVMRILLSVFRWSDAGKIPPSVALYSNVDNRWIIGFRAEKERIIGLQYPPLYFGIIEYPFQSLVGFNRFPPKISLERVYKSDARLEAKAFIKKNSLSDRKNISVLSRELLSLEEIQSRERSGWKRLFENEAIQIWEKE